MNGKGLKFFAIFLSTVVVGCAAPLMRDVLPGIYQGYPGPALSETSLAKVDLGLTDWAEVHGLQFQQRVVIGIRRDNRTEYGAITLRPGRYRVTWGTDFPMSFMVDPRMHAEYQDSAELSLKGGHTYIIQMDRTYGIGYIVYSWIEDEATGKVIYGYKKP